MDQMPNQIDLELKKRTMRGVYAIWFLRSIAPLLAVEFILLAGVAVGVLTHISVRHIMLNAMTASDSFKAFIQFFVDNFFVKSIQSRLLFGTWLVFLILFGRDLLGAIRQLKDFGRDELLGAFASSSGRNRITAV